MDIVAVAPRLPRPGETLTGSSYLNESGGKGANQAYAVAKLGGTVAMLGRVGDDDHGRRMRANLATVNCDVSGVRTVDGSSGVAVIYVAESGENSIVVVPGANHRLTPKDLETDSHYFENAGFVLLQLESPLETVIAAAHIGKRHSARVILDPAPAPISLPRELLEAVDILTPNETEARQLAQVRGVSDSLTVEEARAIAARLQTQGVGTIVVKLGRQGCLLAEPHASTWVDAPRVNAVDTTAAGDVFNGALAVASAEGATLTDACRFAVRAASLSATRVGAQRSVPDRSELGNALP